MSKLINIEDLRKDINDIDKEMALLFNKRMNKVNEIKLYKIENNMEILDKTRETFVINNNLKYVEEKYKDSYIEFIKNLMSISKDYQKRG